MKYAALCAALSVLLLALEDSLLTSFDLRVSPLLRISQLLASPVVFLACLRLDCGSSHSLRFGAVDLCGGIRWIGAWSLGIFCINPLVIYLVRLVVKPRQLLAELPVWTQIILPIPGLCSSWFWTGCLRGFEPDGPASHGVLARTKSQGHRQFR